MLVCMREMILPVERTEQLSHSLLTATVLARWQLYSEGRFRIVVAIDSEATEAIALTSAVLKLRAELLYPDECLVAILVLRACQ